MSKLQDKQSIMHVLSALIHNPEILANDREYPIDVQDFPEKFHQAIFGAITNLFANGAEKITIVEIDGLLSKYPTPYQIFNANNGIEYLENVIELGTPENFELHYNRLRKYSFLRVCDEQGISIKEILDVDTIDLKANQTQQEAFDNMKLDDMVLFMEEKMISLRDQFLFDNNNTAGKVGDIAGDVLDELMSGTSFGAPMSSRLYTAATMGARKGKVQMVSAPSGVGKTRWNLSNALILSVPVLYDKKLDIWYQNPTSGEGVLYIGTELEEEEVITPILCAIAQVDEGDVREGRATEAEKQRLRDAVKILDITPLYYAKLLDFDLADIEHTISKHVNKYNVGYIVHDYVHDSVKLMAYFNKINKGMREDQRLLQVVTRLKELAQKFNVFILTSTQLNSNYKEDGGMDETSIAGAKSMVNKVDNGSIMLELSPKDEKILETILNTHGDGSGKINGMLPNITINIFKSRGTKWKLIRLWLHFDKGMLKIDDLFVTDYKGKIITELKPADLLFDDMEEVDFSELPISIQEQIELGNGKAVEIDESAIFGEHVNEAVEEEYEKSFNF